MCSGGQASAERGVVEPNQGQTALGGESWAAHVGICRVRNRATLGARKHGNISCIPLSFHYVKIADKTSFFACFFHRAMLRQLAVQFPPKAEFRWIGVRAMING